jgi:hypothetical protein
MTAEQHELNSIRARLNRVEKQNRWLLGGVLAALLLGGVVLLAWTSRRDLLAVTALIIASASILLGPAYKHIARRLGVSFTLEADTLVLAGRNGSGVAFLGADGILAVGPEGFLHVTASGADISMSGKGGSFEMDLSADGGCSLSLSGATGETRAQARLDVENGRPSLTLQDAEGKSTALVSVTDEGPEVMLHDKEGTLCALLSVGAKGPQLSLSHRDGEGKSAALIRVTDEGPDVMLYDKRGTLRAELSVEAEGSQLSLSDSEGGPCAWLEKTAEGASLYLLGPNGMVHLSPGEPSDGATSP